MFSRHVPTILSASCSEVEHAREPLFRDIAIWPMFLHPSGGIIVAKGAFSKLRRVAGRVAFAWLLSLAAPVLAQQDIAELQIAAAVIVVPLDRHALLTTDGEPDPQHMSDGPAVVSVSRAADLVGQPLDIISRPSASGTLSLPSGAPLASAVVTSGFGNRRHPILGSWRRHAGMDLAAPYGSEIRATADGVVARAERNGGYGLYIALKHPNGVETSYGHMSRLNVSAGQSVRRGQVIGYVGSTGLATGPHLHYEVRVNGKPVNPATARR